MNTLPNLPIGFIALFPGDKVPKEWRICDGQQLSKSDIPDSFEELSNLLGQTESETETIQLPDLTNRFVVGAGSDAELRSSGEPDQHTHENDPPPQRRYTSYGEQFADAASTQGFQETATLEEVATMDLSEVETTQTERSIEHSVEDEASDPTETTEEEVADIEEEMVNNDLNENEEEEGEEEEAIEDAPLPNLMPMSLEHHNHYVELDIEPFKSEPSEGLNRPNYYALHFVIKVT